MFDFTVILTTFNRPTMLRRAVLSIANQRFDELVPKVQLIVSDDSVGGHPDTLACLSGIGGLQELQLVCLKRASHEPYGVARSRNRALSMAIGKWIVFLDDDDALEPLALSRIASTANRQDADFISGGYSVVHETELGEVDRVEYSSAFSLSYDHLLLSNYFPIGSFAIKKHLLQNGLTRDF